MQHMCNRSFSSIRTFSVSRTRVTLAVNAPDQWWGGDMKTLTTKHKTEERKKNKTKQIGFSIMSTEFL